VSIGIQSSFDQLAASRRDFVPDLVEPAVEVAPDGTIAVPTGPGPGVEVDAGRIARATLRFEALVR
jgi:L-alanine-DL-glutamate epimerase-like enolase superfamily enzyme